MCSSRCRYGRTFEVALWVWVSKCKQINTWPRLGERSLAVHMLEKPKKRIIIKQLYN